MEGLRRLAWRLGRFVYGRARGEPAGGDIATDGEAYVQRCVVGAHTGAGEFRAFDIGANQGDWTLPLVAALPPALRSPSVTRIHLYEPVPATREKLKARLARNGVGPLVDIHSAALSDASGQGSMNVAEETGGRSSLVVDDIEGTGRIAVSTTTLAEAFAQLAVGRAQLVKIDAEGHDPAILRGARDLLAAERIDVVQFEYNHTWVFARAFLKDVFDLVEGLPYRVARIRPGSIEVLDVWHPELERFFHCNYLLVREPALAWFVAHHGRFDGSNTYA